MNGFVQKAKLVLRFYTQYFFASVLVAYACWHLIAKWKIASVIPALLVLKAFTLAIIIYYIHKNRRQQYFFYYNFGLAPQQLWLGSLTIDLVLFISFLLYCIQKYL